MEKHSLVLFPGDKNNANDEKSFTILTLPHPSNQSTLATIIDNTLYELQFAKYARNCCFFLNQRISSSKNVYFLTKLDIRFIILPFLEKFGTKFSPLDQIVTNLPGYSSIPLHLVTPQMMESICDVNDKLGPDMIFYRYSSEKTIQWLKSKVEKVSHVVKAQRLLSASTQSLSYSSSFRTSSDHSNSLPDVQEPIEEDIRLSLELVADSLSSSLQEQLFAAYGKAVGDVLINKHVTAAKRKADWEQEMELEAISSLVVKPAVPVSNANSSAPPTSKPPPPKVAKSNKMNEKAAQGTKSISSFFKK